MKTTLTVAEAAQIVRFVEKVREYKKLQRTPYSAFRNIEMEVHEAEEALFDMIPAMEWIK